MRTKAIARIVVVALLTVVILALAVQLTSTPTSAFAPPSQEETPLVTEVPVGRAWRARQWDEALTNVLEARRGSGSDVTGGRAVVFDATDCLRCHENAKDVEGQIFYGPKLTGFAKDQEWLNEAGQSMLNRPDEGYTPTHEYNFVKAHVPAKVNATIYENGAIPPNVIRQNP